MHAPRQFALLGLILSLVATSAVLASPFGGIGFQDNPSPADGASPTRPAHAAPDPQKQTTRLSRKLQLTPDQAAKIEPILQSRQQQVQQLRGDTSLSPHDLHQKMRAIRQDTDSQIQAILTDSQRQGYQQMQQAAMQKHRDGKQGETGSKPGDSQDDDGGPQ